jgi:hypothetical protein
MKVTIAADGTVTIETDDIDGAAQFVAGLRNAAPVPSLRPRAVVAPTARAEGKKGHRGLAPPRPDRKLSRQLEQSWTYIATHDDGNGVSAPQMAEALRISNGAAGQRFLHLMAKDMVHRVSIGRYSVGPAPDVRDLSVAELNGLVVP